MLLLDALMTRRQLAARGRPQRVPAHQLRRGARIALALTYVLELALVFGAGNARRLDVLVGALMGLLACHVAVYVLESRPGSRKPARGASVA